MTFRKMRVGGNRPLWAFQALKNDLIVADSQQLGVRLLSEEAAAWLGALVDVLARSTEGPLKFEASWSGDLNDDCHLELFGFRAHAEHTEGPKRGGRWYCCVEDDDGHRYFHTADYDDVIPKSGRGARWLCELMIASARSGILSAY